MKVLLLTKKINLVVVELQASQNTILVSIAEKFQFCEVCSLATTDFFLSQY